MSNKDQHRKQKKREKDKRKRASARSRRVRQNVRLQSNADGAAGWPTGDCYISDNWHEPDHEPVHLIFTRRASDGALAAALFSVDLIERGVLDASLRLGIGEGELQHQLVDRSKVHAVLTQDPALVVKIVTAAAQLSADSGRDLPPDFKRANLLFGDISPDDSPVTVTTGAAGPPPARKLGVITRALDRLFRG